jgi:hypothetical protein
VVLAMVCGFLSGLGKSDGSKWKLKVVLAGGLRESLRV